MHLDPEVIAAFATGSLTGDALEAAEAHLDTCASCRHAASAVASAAVQAKPTAEDPEDPEPRPPSPGDVVAERFRLVRRLGQGAQSDVFEAAHLQLNQSVALNLLGRADQHATERILREARALARLESPHVCRVLDVASTADGQPFLVLELLAGETLERRLARRGQVPVTEAVAWTLEAADALAEAHRLGIVHRDIKPANLFLAHTRRGTVLKVLDFGIARSENPTIEQGLASQTRPDLSLGTPLYMAPEQHLRGKVDARADVWALGAVLYELLAGRPPFLAPTAVELRRRVLSEPAPPLGELAPGVPAALTAVVSRCLEREPSRRFEDAEALRRALLALPQAPRGPHEAVTAQVAPHVPARRRRPWPPGAVALGAAGAVVAVLLLARMKPATVTPQRQGESTASAGDHAEGAPGAAPATAVAPAPDASSAWSPPQPSASAPAPDTSSASTPPQPSASAPAPDASSASTPPQPSASAPAPGGSLKLDGRSEPLPRVLGSRSEPPQLPALGPAPAPTNPARSPSGRASDPPLTRVPPSAAPVPASAPTPRPAELAPARVSPSPAPTQRARAEPDPLRHSRDGSVSSEDPLERRR